MKNRLPVAALVFAFTMCGGIVGHHLPNSDYGLTISIIGLIGAVVAFISDVTDI